MLRECVDTCPAGVWTSGTQLDHQMMNLRHLQGHVGQLSEILMAHDNDLAIDWNA